MINVKKIKKSNETKKDSGITLIALVVTIIVLLILAGISIMMLTGNNGILQRAGDAKELTSEEQIAEKVQLAYLAALTEGKGTLAKKNLRVELTKEFGENGYDLSEDTTTNEWIVLVNGIEVLRINAGLEDGDVEIIYTITKNTIKINFKQAYEDLVVKIIKTNAQEYLESQFPGQEITIFLIYQLWEVNNLQEAASKFGYSSIEEMLLEGGATQEELNNIENITGKITLKKGDNVITEGNVSCYNCLEYNLTESGEYTIVGETDENSKILRNFVHEYDTNISFMIAGETYEAVGPLTFRQWIEEYHPESPWSESPSYIDTWRITDFGVCCGRKFRE